MKLAWWALFCAFCYGCTHDAQPEPSDASMPFAPPPSDPGLPTREGDGIKIGDEASAIPGTHPVVDDGSIPGFAGNHSFETAVWLEPDGIPPIANEHGVDQVDYFAFHGRGGTFYALQTEFGTYHPNNVITLYDSDGRALATNDSGSIWPGDDIDARLVVRLPRDGDYYVKVEDQTTTAEVFAADFTLLYYHLTLRTITPETPGYVFYDGTRVLDDYLFDDQLAYSYLTVVGTADDTAPSFQFDGLGDNALIARIHAGGAAGNGSTLVSGRASVRDALGGLLAEVNRESHEGNIRPPVSAGAHAFTLRSDMERGDNPFFAVDLVLLGENPREQNEQANDTAAGAETIKWSLGSRGRGLLLAILRPGDVDYFAIPAAAGGYIGVVCESQTTGSGVRGLTAELRDPTDQRLAASADVDQGLELSSIVGGAGTYYLRLSAAAAAEALPWVRCAVVTG